MLRPLLPLLLALATVGWACALSSQGMRATVLSVGDGDSIRVRRDGRTITVRIACIDAPELDQRPEGERARGYLRQRLPLGREVTLDVKTTDRYGRTVAEVISDTNIGLAMVEDGQAFAFRRYLHECASDEYLQAEERASRRRYGVWQEEGGITRPWEHRRRPRPPQRERPPQAD
jgi:endonuclease YncB( thermonuclease family)